MDGGTTLLRVEQLIDGTGAEPITDAAILIEGSMIDWAGPATALPSERRVEGAVHEFAGATALPGLVDAHAHLSLFADGRSYEDMAAETDERMAMAGAKNAWIHLRSGITTARDNGARNRLGFELRDAIERGVIEGPRLLVSGRPITASGGHFHWCNGTADGEDEIRDTVRRLVSEGADHIKIMASGGGTLGTDPGRASYTLEELRAAVATAHDLDRLTTAHCRAADAMGRAIEAESDCLEHGEFLEPDGVMRFDDDLAERLVASGIYLSPTMAASGWDTILRLRDRRERAGLTEPEERDLRAAEQETETRIEHVGRLIQLGMGPRIVAGTDAGCFDFSFGHLDYSIQLLARAGMTEMETIVAATSASAAACGVDQIVGTLAPGKHADILIVDGNPLLDLDAISKVRAVYKGGTAIGRADIDVVTAQPSRA